MKKHFVGLSLILLSTSCMAQQVGINLNKYFGQESQKINSLCKNHVINNEFNKPLFNNELVFDCTLTNNNLLNNRKHTFTSKHCLDVDINNSFNDFILCENSKIDKNNFSIFKMQGNPRSTILIDNGNFFDKNRRNIYSSLWAFASLNYLYADLVGLMDKNILTQYQSGVVNGVEITPTFLTVAAGFMQIPLANVFLPQVIKNERALRYVQIASGTIMTLVQAGTLFVGKPTPYYTLFSVFEIGTTAFITFDAIRWKPQKKNTPID